MKKNLKGLFLSELEDFLFSLGEKKYRARQLFRWIYQKRVSDFKAMTDLSLSLQLKLKEVAYISELKLIKSITSPLDQTTKFLFELEDGKRIESVLIQEGKRKTVCVSTQVGCPLGCQFCATGGMGFSRNLKASEIVDQVIQVGSLMSKLEKQAGSRITNVVFMGMGEPLLNYQETLRSVRLINSGLDIGARRLTLSTAGLVPEIKKLAEEGLKIKLAIALNATTDRLRSRLMPINKKYPLTELLRAAKEYTEKTGKRLTFEYVLIAGVNDSLQDAQRLAKISRAIPCKINLLPFNPPPDSKFTRPIENRIERFKNFLYPHCPAVTVRESKGKDILAACGQLRS